jgi:FkbM family methyltransferase
MRLKRLAKEILMVSPPLWLKARTWWRKIANKDEAEIGMLRFLVPHDRCAIDVGANNGIYTHKLLEITAQVVAIEPNPNYVKELARIFGSRIRLIPAALSDSEGMAELVVPTAYGGASLGTIEKQNSLTVYDCTRVRVPMHRLDDLSIDNVGFIKIDVEGHEESVVIGAEQTIRRCRPVLLIEAENRHRDGAVEKIMRRLESLGYNGFFLDDGVFKSISSFELQKHQSEHAIAELIQGNSPSVPYRNNFIFIPCSGAGDVEMP